MAGGAVTLSTNGVDASRVIQFAVHFDSAAVDFAVPLNLSALVPGLTIAGVAPMVNITADAAFDFTFGLRLDPAIVDSSSRFFLLADATPEVNLNVTAQIDNPSFSGPSASST